MRRDKLYLHDIVEAADAIQRFLQDTSEETFLEDELQQSAVLQKLIIIGEAASRLSEDFRQLHPEIEWQDIIGFRNIAVHEYFAINWGIVWVTAVQDAPLLSEQMDSILALEFSEE